MFEKQKISFKNKSIFGYAFRNNIDNCFCTTSKMLFSGKINADGTIDESKSDTFLKSELWSYIYYVYYYNSSDVDEFIAMKQKKTGFANAMAFYSVVKAVARHHTDDVDEILPMNSSVLIKFINNVIVEYGDDLVNPVIDYLKLLMKKKLLANLKGVKIVTGNTSGTFEIVTGDDVKNANVRIGIQKQ